ncbi:hypothetical protein CsSME_00045750 [Camellia sinensis var. sinensis]
MEVQNKQHPSHDEEQVVVIMVPFPSQSHLNQLLEHSCLISSYNIPDSQFTMPVGHPHPPSQKTLQWHKKPY